MWCEGKDCEARDDRQRESPPTALPQGDQVIAGHSLGDACEE
jgi:hypothetical protein